jgi:DNA-binding beta-propeller fold protein YncE
MRSIVRLLACAAFAGLACAQFPPLPFKVQPAWPSLPSQANFMETAGVAVDSSDHVYVFHRGPMPVMKFDAQGSFIRGWGDGLFDRPHSMRVDRDGFLWTVDDGSHTVLKMDAQGRVRMVLGRFRTTSDAKSAMSEPTISADLRGLRDEGVVRFNRPTDVAFGPGGDIFVADGYGNSRVVKFDKNGKFVKTWGKRGAAEGDFNTPHSIAVDRTGRVWVADRENYRIQVFDGDGRFLAQFKGMGSPWGLALAPDNHMMMADGYNCRVVKLTMDGKVVGAFGEHGKQPGQFHYCHQLAVDSKGNVYTAEILNWRPQKFVP